LTHRSGDVAIAVSRKRIDEINRRILKLKQHYQEYVKMALTDRESLDLMTIVVQTTLKHMSVDMEHIREYIHDHMESSTGSGVKWAEMLSVTQSEWHQIIEQVRDLLERILANPGQWAHVPWNYGMRARRNSLNGFPDHHTGQIDRTRIIVFYVAFSIITAFISDKVGWYSEILEECLDYLGVEGEYVLPLIVGGKVYTLASEYFNDGLDFVAYDGKSWESGVPIILGYAFRSFFIHVQGLDMLPSGISFTSLFGTLAMIIASRYIKGIKAILGDDLNVWSPGKMPNLWSIEYQEMDTKLGFILGVIYSIDPLMPRLTGFEKISMDRAGKMEPLNLDGEWKVVSLARHESTRALWLGCFLGWFGPRTLVQAISSVPPGKYLNPQEYFERMINEAQVPMSDALEWARSIGVKEVVIT
jgi:hypothetical protein